MEYKIKKLQGSNYAYYNDILFNIWKDKKLGWVYYTRDTKMAEMYGLTYKDWDTFNLPIKDMKSTRGFTSHLYCTYKGYLFYVNSFYDNLFSISPVSDEAARFFGFNYGQFMHEMCSIHVPLSDLEEIHYERKKLGDFIFDVEPIEYVWKDGKWLIEPVDGVYII